MASRNNFYQDPLKGINDMNSIMGSMQKDLDSTFKNLKKQLKVTTNFEVLKTKKAVINGQEMTVSLLKNKTLLIEPAEGVEFYENL